MRINSYITTLLAAGAAAFAIAAAPMAAPAAAPTAVPSTAPVAVVLDDALPALVPVCWSAHWRQTASSCWNCRTRVSPLNAPETSLR